MLDNINSMYIIKFLLSFMEDGVKLNLIRYNKSLQNKIDINLMNYKRFARKYLIYDCKKWKEYDILTNKLIYEGEYLNGKRNGKGKDY